MFETLKTAVLIVTVTACGAQENSRSASTNDSSDDQEACLAADDCQEIEKDATASDDGGSTPAITNTAPIANSGTIEAERNIDNKLKLNGSDTDGDALVYTIVTPPSLGSLIGLDTTTGEFIYRMSGTGLIYNAVRTDSISYKVSDGKSDSELGTMQIKVFPVNFTGDWQASDVKNISGETCNDFTFSVKQFSDALRIGPKQYTCGTRTTTLNTEDMAVVTVSDGAGLYLGLAATSAPFSRVGDLYMDGIKIEIYKTIAGCGTVGYSLEITHTAGAFQFTEAYGGGCLTASSFSGKITRNAAPTPIKQEPAPIN